MENNIQDQILKPMEVVRKYCSLGHKLRQKHNIPVAYPLYEMRINELEVMSGSCLLKEERELINQELNIDHVEPIFNAGWSKTAIVVMIEEGRYRIALDITKRPHLDRRYEARLEHRRKMEERKLNDSNTAW